MIDPLHDGQPGFLQHVIRVNTSVQPRIHPEVDHSPQPITVLRKQGRKGFFVAADDTVNQFTFFVGFRHFSGLVIMAG